MKKLVFLFSLCWQPEVYSRRCDDSKTYAEMLEDEKNAVNKFIKDKRIQIIHRTNLRRMILSPI